ncbi:Pleckstrin likey-like domain family B member 2 [Pseudolycoriella hygida]|uniref:Pleckstrin likey-like domain family B member 2 n=1 Tax=Pseudolycoriella hygida TaxID=35572 RepID=A0A9Q0NFZ8_9DIPT|nr:Pleckstrin likey-like domain family B member 2 [Pseudolycoriella hygida]
MLTIGKSTYLRFNNPAEAELIKSSMGSNDRISMPQIDFNQDSSSSNEGTPVDALKNLNEIIDLPNHQKSYQNNETILNSLTKNDITTNFNNFHSPKVFTADSVTVNTPAKDVLGAKFNNFTKNLTQIFTKNDKNSNMQRNGNENNCVLTKVNNTSVASPKIQPSSACYDRYPKPGSYGSLQVFPMNGVNSEINNSNQNDSELQRQRAQIERLKEQEMSLAEQERLEEILKMCADFEKQNQNVQSSPIVQNRIKTNGSLPRDKKSPFADYDQQKTLFFPTVPNGSATKSSGYENVKFGPNGRVELTKSPSGRYENVNQSTPTNGYENVNVSKKYVPQSPRTKIRTCVSPKKEPNKKTEYELLVQSFEEKLRMEIQSLRENKHFDGGKSVNGPEPVYGTLEKRNKNVNNLTLNIQREIDGQKLVELTHKRTQVLNIVRDLKTQISDLQRQEEEVLRELDMEKALVSAELSTEREVLKEMEKNLSSLQCTIHRLEAQRNSKRVMQETQQAKLKQMIDVAQDQVNGLESLLKQNSKEENLQEDLENVRESLENDTKTFEDLEFQYLEEETEWLAYREELHHDLKTLTKLINEKQKHILTLENQGIDNQATACLDTKNIEKNLWTLLSDLEKNREELKAIDMQIFHMSGQQNTQSESDEEFDVPKRNGSDIMSQSMFGSTEILSAKPKDQDLMSKSMNEEYFFSSIEMPSINVTKFSSTPKKNEIKAIDASEEVTKISQTSHDQLKKAEEADRIMNGESPDPLTKLKYNLSPPFDHKSNMSEPKSNLNLSIESDDFEVNPLEKRVPSQDDIDRICKVTLDAPISTHGASYKVIESIKEIERNRQLLLAQQGSHVIEHERQKMNELKKKSHDEARAQYLRNVNYSPDRDSYVKKNRSLEQLDDTSSSPKKSLQRNGSTKKDSSVSPQRVTFNTHAKQVNLILIIALMDIEESSVFVLKSASGNDQRHSQPDFDRSRPLSEANSELSYDALSEKPFKSSNDLHTSISSQRLHENGEVIKRNSALSQSDTSDSPRMTSGQKRNLPKHQRPLTRYLPIMSSDLDLRQHIETAGHQVTLCPHVIVDSYSCRGYLHKLGATFHGWSRRWFVLDRQKMALIYYSDKSERKARGGAYFSTIDEVYLDHMNTSKSGRPYCTFIVKTKKRSYHLQAASDAAARIWIDAIITGAQGNIDY